MNIFQKTNMNNILVRGCIFSTIFLISAISSNGQGNLKGWQLIKRGTDKYEQADFEGAIMDLQLAFNDPSLVAKESTFVYFLLGFSYIKLNDKNTGYDYFKKILIRNPLEKLEEGFEEFESDFERIRDSLKKVNSCNLKIISKPEDADVYLNENYAGRSPISFSLIKDKIYDIVLEKSGYEIKSITIFLHKDTSLFFKLNVSDRHLPRLIAKRTSIYSYLFGATTGALLGLASGFTSIYFDNRTNDKIKNYLIEQDPDKAKKLKSEISQSHFLSSLFYYSSYILTAIGFFAGVKTSEPIFQENTLLNDESKTTFYCLLDRDFKPTLYIRRNIW